ncbi:serine hydrolase domain-containing protein [Sphingobacterium anhuiense]|uniref:serine hydrolase domain-containing protein n=1 Tax=Sphingobacterium anhuiense TaxID=493780 RepID=UPI003C2CE4E6
MKKCIQLLVVTIIFSCTNNKTAFSQDTIAREIVSYLDSLDGFSGAVLIAKDDHVLLQKSYGFAHLGHKVKNNTDTKFSYASIGKSFTAVSIFQLIQAGKLSLDDPIGKFLPNYPNKVARDSITIRLLLMHRSGLADYFYSDKFLNSSKVKFRTIESLSDLYENEPLEFKPNEQFSYRNTNYIVLGRIIETVSKMPYEDYIKKQ